MAPKIDSTECMFNAHNHTLGLGRCVFGVLASLTS